ncbi:hypothetical protein RM844_26265 [Streptomyces sp. DSM 44915]|uniref:Uncharacterized protein n=1 Tax=Streptomyces chisholmiae TaxID=3075540 RepID=A0ABU2JZ47_9ACTN|nr:hypothetical protein [Streptomyces sp. DSM 44915]MDT0269794.1 hypothetical protein [Streptomyces sp. DSM 44915]
MTESPAVGHPPFPVLWLCGPPGVGKTTTGWALHQRLARRGERVGYLDIDQLGMNFPEPPDDPGRHRLKTRNLGALLANYRAAGARCLIVSGVVDAARGVRGGDLPGARLTVCRLSVGPDELRRRYLGRGSPPAGLPEVLAEAEALARADLADLRLDTGGLAPIEVADRLLAHWPSPVEPSAPASVGPAPPRPDGPEGTAGGPGEVLWLCGATGVGKSQVGWEVFQRALRAAPAALVDLAQLGFLRPAPADDPEAHRLRAANLAALHANYAALGTRRLVVVGPVRHPDTVADYRRRLPGVRLTLARLDASAAPLLDRVLRRGAGHPPFLPGDPLTGKPAPKLRRIAAAAAGEAAALADAGLGDLSVDTDGRSVTEVADALLARWRWAPAGPDQRAVPAPALPAPAPATDTPRP